MSPAPSTTTPVVPTTPTSTGPEGQPLPLAATCAIPGVGPLALAPATEADFETLRALHAAAMRPSVEHLMGWDADAQAARLRRHFSPGTLRWLTVGGAVIGCVDCYLREDGGFLAQFYLEPAWQGQGIGRTLLAHVQQAARAGGHPLRLHVLKESAARRLYARAGFVLEGGDAFQDYLIWRPETR